MCTRLTMYWSVQTRTCINIPCEVPTLEEERTFTFFNGYNLSVSPVTRWWDLPGLPCSELSYWSWSNTEVVGELGMRLWRTSVPRVLRVTEKLNNTGSVDDKFLIVKRQVCNTQASRVHLKGKGLLILIFSTSQEEGGGRDPEHTLFMNNFSPFTMG